MVANKPIGVQMFMITGSSNHYVAVYRATHRKHDYSRMFAIIATVANGAVRLSIGLRLVGFIHVFREGDANGHRKVESVAKIIILYGDVDLENLISVSIGRMARHGTIDSEIAEWRL